MCRSGARRAVVECEPIGTPGLIHKEMTMRAHSIPSVLAALLVTGAASAATSAAPSATIAQERANASVFIVQGSNVTAALHAVQGLGVEPSQKLEVIRSVAANLTPSQVERLRATGFRVYADRQLRSTGLLDFAITTANNANSTAANVFVVQSITQLTTPTVFSLLATQALSAVTSPVVKSFATSAALQDGTGVAGLTLLYETNYPALIGADTLQRAGITGKGVTIAMLDTGFWNDTTQFYGTRVLATRDVTNGGTGPVTGDTYGHGTHITSIAAGGARGRAGRGRGIAPKANLVVGRAFDGYGAGRYVDVISGINWIVANKAKYNNRVLNLSLGVFLLLFFL